MKFTLSARRLAADVKALLPATATRSALPILSGVLLDASEHGLAMETTDLELTARRLVREDVTVDAAGSLVVPAKALAKAVAAMDQSEIALESTDGGALEVRAGGRTVALQGSPADDWPRIPTVAGIEPMASIDASAAADAFQRVARCASDDEAGRSSCAPHCSSRIDPRSRSSPRTPTGWASSGSRSLAGSGSRTVPSWCRRARSGYSPGSSRTRRTRSASELWRDQARGLWAHRA